MAAVLILMPYKPDVLCLFQGIIPAQQGDGKSRLGVCSPVAGQEATGRGFSTQCILKSRRASLGALRFQVVDVLLREPAAEMPVP